MIVLDASVVVEWLAGGARLERVLPWLEAHESEFHAPGLVDVEVAHVIHLTACDAAYVALAEALSGPLLTDGVRIARAAGLAVSVRSPDGAPGG